MADLKIFNKMWKEKQFPKRWKIGLVKPIPNGGTHKEVQSYKELTLIEEIEEKNYYQTFKQEEAP